MKRGLVAIGLTLLSTPAWAQGALRSRVELSSGASWIGEQPAGSATATLTENPSGNRFTFFDTTSRVQSAWGWSVRGALRVWGPLYLEGTFEKTAPVLLTTISHDTEGASGTLTAELSRTIMGGSLRLDVERLSFHRGRATPFLLAGGGRLRVSQGDFEETGSEIHAGLGLRHRTIDHPIGPVKAIGLRLEGLLAWHEGGIDFANERRALSQADLSLVLFF